jgi:hypothetical protein
VQGPRASLRVGLQTADLQVDLRPEGNLARAHHASQARGRAANSGHAAAIASATDFVLAAARQCSAKPQKFGREGKLFSRRAPPVGGFLC